MSAHYSKHLLNTYNHTPYFQAHIPENYPLEKVLQKSRAFRRLPPNLRELSEKSKQWAIHNLGPRIGIERWYDDEGYELDPDSGKRLNDKEVDESWPDLSALNKFKVTDIPIPRGGFPDPQKWEEPAPLDKPKPYEGPDEKKLIEDIKSHGREYAAKYWGIPEDTLKNSKTDKELAQAILAQHGGK